MRTRFTLLAIICLVALSCTTNILEPQNKDAGPVELVFSAGMNDNAETKTVLNEEGTAILWSPHDTIMITCGEASGRFISTNTEPSNKVTFRGSLDLATGTMEGEGGETPFFAVYPYNAVRSSGTTEKTVLVPYKQTASEGTFAPGMFPAVAQSTNLSLGFYNLCGGIAFTVKDEGITSVILRGNNEERISGDATVFFSAGIPNISNRYYNTYESVELLAPNNGSFKPGVRYFISIFPTEFTKGITITFVKNKAYRSDVTWEKPANVKRSRFLVINNADAGAGEYIYVVPQEAEFDLLNLYDAFAQSVASQGNASLYAPLRALFNFCGDDVYGAGSYYGDNDFLPALNEFRYKPDNNVVGNLYAGLYKGIRSTNEFLKKYEEDFPKFVAPARVLRAYMHMMLAIGWGTPPLEDHVLGASELPYNCDKDPKRTLTHKQLLEWCAQECESVIPALTERESPQDTQGAYRVTKGFAQAIAGKAYLFAGNYEKAKALLGDVINSGKYALVPGSRYWENFHIEGDGNEEKIYEPNLEYVPGTSAWGGAIQRSTWMESNLLNWRSDRFIMAPHNYYCGVAGWGSLGVPQAFGDAFLANDGKNSYRLNATLMHIDDAVGGMTYGDAMIDSMTKEQKLASTSVGITVQGLYGQSFWLPFKQLVKKTDANSAYGSNVRLNNYTIMRYAEVLLLYAEACIQTGDATAALNAINQIQRRAGSQTISATVDMDVLKREKQYELWFEGCRWADLIRWGDTSVVEQAGKVIPVLYDKFTRAPYPTDENVVWENGTEENSRFYTVTTHGALDQGLEVGYVAGKHNLFPYPASVLEANTNLTQNPGW